MQESCGRFETFIDLFPKYKPHQRLSSTPEPGLDAYNTVRQQQLLMAQALDDIRVNVNPHTHRHNGRPLCIS